jgi:flagellar basal body rod protein FlgC
MKALGIAATGMLAQQTNVDVIANNIANAKVPRGPSVLMWVLACNLPV